MSNMNDLLYQCEIQHIGSKRNLEEALGQLENVDINDISIGNAKRVAQNVSTACQSYRKMMHYSISVSILRWPETVFDSQQRLLVYLLGKGQEIISNELKSIAETKPYVEKLEQALDKVRKMNELCGYDIMTHNAENTDRICRTS